MHAYASKAYQRVDVESAPKPQILDRLFGRLCQDADAARAAIAGKDIKGKAAAIDHALQIVTELKAALDHGAAPELCANLAALYDYMMERLSRANAFLDGRYLDEVTAIATQLRQAFAEAATASPTAP